MTNRILKQEMEGEYTDLVITEELRNEALKAISVAKSVVVSKNKATFLIAILLRLPIYLTKEIPTLATNSLKIWVNPHFILESDRDLRVFGLLHEVLHVAYGHCSRFLDPNLDRQCVQAAVDYVVNGDLVQAGMYCPSWAYHDPKYYGWSAEQIYDDLVEQKETGKNDAQYRKVTASNNLFDNDLIPEGENSVNDPNPTPPMTAEEYREAVEDMVIDAATQAEMASDYDSVPASIKRMLDKLRNPKLPWKVILKRFLFELDKSSTSWRRPNKRLLPIYTPTREGHKLGQINFAIDVSGSINEETFNTLCAEVYSVLNVLKPDHIELIQFDHEICGKDKVRTVQDLMKVKFNGGGGTYLEPVMQDFINSKAKALIVLTDGYFSNNITDPNRPVIWAVYDNPNWLPPFGRVVHFSSK